MSDFIPAAGLQSGPAASSPEARPVQLSREDALAALTTALAAKLAETAQNLVEIGQLLIQAKRLLGHGRFRTWLGEHFSMSAKTANRFMSVAQMVARHELTPPQVDLLLSLDLKSLYELAAKSTPHELQRNLINDLCRQRELSYAQIRSRKLEAQHAPDQSPTDLSGFTMRLQRFTTWLEAHQDQFGQAIDETDPASLAELGAYARKLAQAQALVEALLHRANASVDEGAPGDGHHGRQALSGAWRRDSMPH